MATAEQEVHFESMLAVRKTKRYDALTGLRAVAAYMVVIFHENTDIFTKRSETPTLLNHFVFTWSIGVTIFFVLSGFLISLRYGDSVEFSRTFFWRYFQNRFARIYPVYFLLTAVVLVLFAAIPRLAPPVFDHATWKDWLVIIFLNIILLRGFFADLFMAGVAPAWSLTVEESFYMLAVPMLLLIRRQWWPLLVYPVLFTLIGFGLVYVFQDAPYGFFDNIQYMASYTFFGRCLEFILGMAVGRFFHRITLNTNYTLTLSGVVGVVLCMLAITALNYTLTPDYKTISVQTTLVALYALPWPVALLLLGLAKERTWLSSFLSLPWMLKLGTASYALYLIHFGPLQVLITENVSELLIVKLLIYTALSLALYKFVEHPLQERLRAAK